MEKDYRNDEIRAVISAAVNAALDARDAKKTTVLLGREAVAERLRVDVSTLWRWNRSGYFRVTTKLGRKVMYSEEAVEMLEKGKTIT